MRAYTPIAGHDWNPLRKYRNVACYCRSGKKAKRCHGRIDILPDSEIARVRAYLRALSIEGLINASKGDIG